MPSFTEISVLALVAGFASAAPLEAFAGGSSVIQVRNPNYVRHGPSALAKAYLKFGATMPTGLAATMANYTLSRRSPERADGLDGIISLKGLKGTKGTKGAKHSKSSTTAAAAVSTASTTATAGNASTSGTGSAVTTPESNDVEFLTPVQIGTPPQTLNLDFDTGSSDLWVFSSLMPTSEVRGQTTFKTTTSSTAKKITSSTWSITYGDGSASSGVAFTDTVSIGGLSFGSQAVEAAEKVSTSFTSDSNNDGLVGLAFSTINTVKPTQQKTFFDNVQSSLPSALFTADLKHDAPGTYNFGFIDSTAFNGTIAYTPVDNSQGFWSFTSTGFAIGSEAFQSTSFAAIADTGTSLALIPDQIVTSYYAKVTGAKNSQAAGGFIFPCTATLSDFTFGVGTSTITIPADFINFAANGDGTCFGGLQSDSGVGFSILGDVALKAAFVVFDNTDNTPQLGFASKVI